MELNETTFLLVVAGYVIGGLVCVVIGATGLGARSGGGRLLAVGLGVASVVYAGYLMFWPTESVWIFPYMLLVPFIFAFKAIQTAFAGRQRTA